MSVSMLPESFYGKKSKKCGARNSIAPRRKTLQIESLENRMLLASGNSLTGDWTTYGNGPNHSGYFPGTVGTVLNGELRWSKVLGDQFNGPSGLNPVVSGQGLVFVTTKTYYTPFLAAIDARSGTEVWRHEFAASSQIGPPTYDQGHVYVQRINGSKDSQLWSFDVATGLIDWTTPFYAQFESYMAPLVIDGSIYIGGGYYGGINRFQQSSGEYLYAYALPQIDHWTPASSDGHTYSWLGHSFIEHSNLTGQAVWEILLFVGGSNSMPDRVPVIADHQAFVVGGARQGNPIPKLFGIDLNTHKKLWEVEGRFVGNPAIAQGIVFVIENKQIKTFDANTGGFLGAYEAGDELVGQPIITDDSVIVSSHNRTFIFDRANKYQRLILPAGGDLSIANNVLYIGSSSGIVSAYSLGLKPFLRLQIPSQVRETEGKLVNKGSVTSDKTLTKDLIVNLTTNAPQRITVPAFVRIRAGATSATFDIEILDNNVVDIAALIVVSAFATDFDNGSGEIKVVDDNSEPDLSLVGDWTSYGGGPSHTGNIPGTVGNNVKSETRWTFDLGTACRCLVYDLNQIATGEGIVFATSYAQYYNYLIAIDAKTGELLWRYEFADYSFISPPTYDRGHIYVQRVGLRYDSQVWSFDALSGVVDWTARYAAEWPQHVAPTVLDGTVYIIDQYLNKILAFRQSDGEQLSFQTFVEYDPKKRTSYDGKPYGWIGGVLSELSPTAVDTVWSLDVGVSPINSYNIERYLHAALANKTAFAIDLGLLAIDLETHIPRWVVRGDFSGSPSVANGTVFAIQQGQVKAFDATTGNRRGVYDAGELLAGQPIVTDDAIIVSSEKHTFVFDRITRAIRFTLPAGGILSLANDTLLVASESGIVSAFTLRVPSSLSVEVPARVSESAGKLVAQGVIEVDKATSSDLVINLASSDPLRVKIPKTLTIRSGLTAASFDIEILDNLKVDVSSKVLVKAFSNGYDIGRGTLQVLDDDRPSDVGLSGDWATVGNGSSHTNYVPGSIGTDPIKGLRWSTSFGQRLNQVAVKDGMLYVTPNGFFPDAFLAAIDARTGIESWRYSFPKSKSISPVTYDNGHVYVQQGSQIDDSRVWSFDAISGKVDWTSLYIDQLRSYSAPTVSNGMVFVDGGFSGGLIAIQQSTGERLYYRETASYDRWTPTIHNGRLFTWIDGDFTEHLPATGEALWSIDLGWNFSKSSMNSLAAIEGNNAYVIGHPGLYAIDLTTHKQLWKVGDAFAGSPALAQDTVFATQQGLVKAYDASTGAPRGVYDAREILSGQVVVTDDSIIATSETNTFIFDRATRINRTTLPYGGKLSIADDSLYIASATGFIAAIQLHPTLSLSLPAQASEATGKLVGRGVVNLEHALDHEIVVMLDSSSPFRVKVPKTIVIPLGFSSATFDIEILDNVFADLDTRVFVNASAPGYFHGSAAMDVLDDEPAVLNLILPSRIQKGDGTVRGAGTINVDRAPSKDTIINLHSSNTDKLGLPATVTLRANTTSSSFDLLAIDNLYADGPIWVEVTAESARWKLATKSIEIVDDEIPPLISGASSPWQNPRDNKDVNGDSFVSPIDVLILINQLNRFGSGRLGKRRPAFDFIDVDGDGFESPLDPLLIINWLNSHMGDGEDQEARSIPSIPPFRSAVVGVNCFRSVPEWFL